MAYSKQVVDRFESVLANPGAHGVGRFDPKDPMVASGMVGAPSCGDVMKLDLKLDEDDTIVDVISEPFARNRIHSDRHLAFFGKSRNVITNMLARKVFRASRRCVFAVDDHCIGSTFGQLRDEVGPDCGREQQ